MNPEIKSEWTTALRSGEYEQGTGMLRSADDKFCCLGVLCDLAVQNGVIPKPDVCFEDETAHEYLYGADQLGGILPSELVKWAGLESHSPSVGGDNLSHLNDGGTPFPEIADLIERHL